MTRAQCIVHRGDRILMVKHRWEGSEWWCLPGGGVEPGETSAEAAVRELEEECNVTGKVIRKTSHVVDHLGIDTITFLLEIDAQEPSMGTDPELRGDDQILVDMKWLSLAEICERDRAYLWAAGLMSVVPFLEEVSDWSDDISYPSV